VAVNPKNPNNLVYHVMWTKQTYACEKQGDANCTTFSFGLAQGQFNDPHWTGTKVFVSFDRGRTWRNAKVPPVPKYRGFPGESNDHSDLTLGGDPMVTATADGTFYIAWDISHETLTPITDSSGGVAVSKSKDGGRTWSTPVLTGTPLDRPWMTTDLSTGTIYLASGSPPGTGSLGSFSTGNNKQPLSTPPGDRWLVSSHDGVHWTAPQRLGGGGVPGFSGASGDTISAAHGVLAATFVSTDASACQLFVGGAAPCTVFQTTNNAGRTWTRHRVPVTTESAASVPNSVLVAANPRTKGTYSTAVLDPTETKYLVYLTRDSGATWKSGATVTDDSTTTKMKAWMSSSPDGALGLTWRSHTHAGDGETLPYQVYAATSRDSGATFSAPLRISTEVSPGPDPTMLEGGDDTSFINLNNQNAFIVWGDWRHGDVSGYFSAVRLAAFVHR
jgi:hypothetical protein